MRGEEFFGEISEHKAVDDFDTRSWLFGCLIIVPALLHYELPNLHNRLPLVDVFFVASYLLEVVGFFIIFCDLFLERQTKQFLDWYARFSFTHPQSFGWKGAVILTVFVVPLLIFFMVLGELTFSSHWDLYNKKDIGYEVLMLFALIYPGCTLIALKIKNDRLLAMGVGTAIVGLTLSTSAYINTLFF